MGRAGLYNPSTTTTYNNSQIDNTSTTSKNTQYQYNLNNEPSFQNSSSSSYLSELEQNTAINRQSNLTAKTVSAISTKRYFVVTLIDPQLNFLDVKSHNSLIIVAKTSILEGQRETVACLVKKNNHNHNHIVSPSSSSLTMNAATQVRNLHFNNKIII